MEREHYQDALSLLACAPADAATAPDAMLLRAMLLVNTGEIEAPQRVCRELLAADELNAGAHYIMAICREHVGDRAAALDHSHAAAYLDAAFAMPHLQLGRLARRTGDRVTARRELALALDLLPREDAARIILFGGGFGRDVLVRLCRAELDACEVAR
jgi:chemotaxis protein methyltransferase CheR